MFADNSSQIDYLQKTDGEPLFCPSLPILSQDLNRDSISKKQILVVILDFDFHVVKGDLVEK